MKNLKQYITEKLRLNGPGRYNYFPETREELDDIINQLIEERGNNADLNDIDVSNITDMQYLFAKRALAGDFEYNRDYNFSNFNGDISEWNVSKVTNMRSMFNESKFDGDISKWNVSNVTNMQSMFWVSSFNGDISKWDVSNVTDMYAMFTNSKFTGDISNWDVSNVNSMYAMFADSVFNQDISNWKLNCDTEAMFTNCPLEDQPEKWPQNYKK